MKVFHKEIFSVETLKFYIFANSELNPWEHTGLYHFWKIIKYDWKEHTCQVLHHFSHDFYYQLVNKQKFLLRQVDLRWCGVRSIRNWGMLLS